MFDSSRLNNLIPGYTGYIPKNDHEEDLIQMQKSRARIPGYAGYISGVKSENLFGKTYGKITYESSNKNLPRGVELTPDTRYTSEAKGNYIDQREWKKREATKKWEIANQENVQEGIPVSQIYKFFAYEDKYSERKHNDEAYEKTLNKELEKKNLANESELKKVQSLLNFYGDDRKIMNTGQMAVQKNEEITLSYEEANKKARS